MNPIPAERYLKLHGTPYQVGHDLGRHLGPELAEDIEDYLTAGPARFNGTNMHILAAGAMGWYDSLPERFRHEMEGLSDGADIPLKTIATWGYADAGGKKACSSFIYPTPDGPWIGRNNDLWALDLWGYAIQRHVTGRLGTLIFGLRGEIFAATGINSANLWLHYNWLPAFGPISENGWTPFVLLSEILETCATIDEVEAQLFQNPRTGGMLIFAVDGSTGAYAMLECAPQQVTRIDGDGDPLSGTNHFQACATPQPAQAYAPASVARLYALNEQLKHLPTDPELEELRGVLAHPEVEQHQADYGTVYANLYNPLTREIWFTFGGYPAASRGNWQAVPWPF